VLIYFVVIKRFKGWWFRGWRSAENHQALKWLLLHKKSGKTRPESKKCHFKRTLLGLILEYYTKKSSLKLSILTRSQALEARAKEVFYIIYIISTWSFAEEYYNANYVEYRGKEAEKIQRFLRYENTGFLERGI